MTNNDKLSLTQNIPNSVNHNPSYGPTFGGGYDLIVCNQANTSKGSYTNTGNTYTNPKYTSNKQQSWELISGSKNGYNFLIKEWEVYQIIYDWKL